VTKSALLQALEESVPVEVFKAEVAVWARRVGVTYRELHVRPMKRKWASCSSRGRLTFDADLPKQPAAFRAEAIVHELLHLKVPNHGRLFSALLKSYLREPGRPRHLTSEGTLRRG
jgi:predicted metal-dependent hydrolase